MAPLDDADFIQRLDGNEREARTYRVGYVQHKANYYRRSGDVNALLSLFAVLHQELRAFPDIDENCVYRAIIGEAQVTHSEIKSWSALLPEILSEG